MGNLFNFDNLRGLASGLKVSGALMEGFGSGSEADFQAAIARRNAEIASQNASYATQAGEIATYNQQLKTRAIVGQTKAAQAASGIDVNTGSAKAVQESEKLLGRLDAMTIRSEAARAAYGYQTRAAVDSARAKMYRRAGAQARIGGVLDAGATLLESASSSRRQHQQWKEVAGAEGSIGNLMNITDDSGEAVWS